MRRDGRLLALTTLALAVAASGSAEVVGVEILSREAFAGGAGFGETGPYEKIRGTLHYAIDPAATANRVVVDLDLAPRDESGRVVFSGDFLMLKPVDLARGNHRLFYDVTNRGSLVALSRLNGAAGSNDPHTAAHAGNGFLMRQGYTMLWSAWNWDVLPGSDRLQIDIPRALRDGQPLTGTVVSEIVVNERVTSQPVAWGRSRGYPAAHPGDPDTATLTVREAQRGPREEIPRSRWRFGRLDIEDVVADPTWIYLPEGFEPGRIYELVYEATDARVVGLGLAAIRDAISFFRYETQDASGRPSPLRVESDTPRSDVEHAYVFGVSQSGRVIQHMLWQGFHVDEDGRAVFDGAIPHVSGAGKGSFNHRFAQTTRHPSHLQDHQYPADVFPFTTTPQTDPVTGRSGDVLARARESGHVPKVLYTGTASEYWARAASLLHTDTAGARDWPLDERVRLYFFAGAQHQISSSIDPGRFAYTRNVLDHAPPLRALLVALDRWVSEDVLPPPSAYPRIDRSELISAPDYARRFPRIPGVEAPADCLMPPRLDFGPRFATEGIIDVHPPRFGPAYDSRVPAPDADGNDLAGLRLPDVAVPLGTYVGWNRRGEEMGATDFLARWAGSFFPFAATRAERESRGDPRPSLEERYASAEEYLSRLEQAASRLVEQGYLLEEDASAIVQRARDRGWPPSFE
jgi:hypothetical protein